MIEVKINVPGFEYDVHALIKAFYPREEVWAQTQAEFIKDTSLRLAVEVRGRHEDGYGPGSGAVIRLWEDGEQKAEQEASLEGADLREGKNRVKRLLYTLLSQYTDGNHY